MIDKDGHVIHIGICPILVNNLPRSIYNWPFYIELGNSIVNFVIEISKLFIIYYSFSDFGFLLESSPGGNLGFEVDFKLDDMYINLLGADGYHCFVQLFILALLAVRYGYFAFGNRLQLQSYKRSIRVAFLYSYILYHTQDPGNTFNWIDRESDEETFPDEAQDNWWIYVYSIGPRAYR